MREETPRFSRMALGPRASRSIDGRRGLIQFAAILVAALVAIEAVVLAFVVIIPSEAWSLGMDFEFYRDVGQRFMTTGEFYNAHQLDGPYAATLMVDVLYPPIALLLFVPFVYLPWIAWWAIPIGAMLVAFSRIRPSPVAILAMLVLLAWPRATGAFLFGNTDMWIAAAIAAGSVWGWPLAVLLIKPTAVIFALPFIRDRRAWIGAALIGVIGLAMLPLWTQYIVAMRGMSIDVGYSLGSIPLYLVPLVAWFGRTRSTGAAA